MASPSHRMRAADRAKAPDRARQQRLEQLLSLQGTVLRNRRQILRDSQPLSGIDAEETSVDAGEQGIGFSLLELTSRTVRGIETALQRLEAGEFGACSECGGEIGEARLRALPFAALCLTCQERRDIAASPASHLTVGGKMASR